MPEESEAVRTLLDAAELLDASLQMPPLREGLLDAARREKVVRETLNSLRRSLARLCWDAAKEGDA